jgi:predicted RNA binding protein YcfA (HicA-like mRNA interferase family)
MSSLINNDINLTYGKLDKMLLRLGYTHKSVNGSHAVYTNRSSLLAIKRGPKANKVPAIVVSSVVTNIVNSKIANRKKIESVYSEIG